MSVHRFHMSQEARQKMLDNGKRHNIPTKEIINQLKEAIAQNKNYTKVIFKDEIWKLSISYVKHRPNELSFWVGFEYKNSLTNQTLVKVKPNCPIYIQDDTVKIRKDIYEKIEAIAEGFFGQKPPTELHPTYISKPAKTNEEVKAWIDNYVEEHAEELAGIEELSDEEFQHRQEAWKKLKPKSTGNNNRAKSKEKQGLMEMFKR